MAWLSSSNVQKEHDRIIFTDCLYKNIYKFKYLAYIDIDEVCVRLAYPMSPPFAGVTL